MMINKVAKTIHIADVACAWEPRLLKKELEKHAKYQPDLANQYSRFRIYVMRVVIWGMGTVGNLLSYLNSSCLVPPAEIYWLISSIQREALIKAVRMVKRHLAI